MFKSGFLIFLITEKKLLSSKDANSLPILYKRLVINNKLNLIDNTYQIFNMNSLRYIMIKLGIIYKEFYLIEKAMEGLKGFDLKTAHLFMQYIVETSDLSYVVDNLNDNFFIYSIRTAIKFMIKLFQNRVDSIKNNPVFKETKFLKNTKFLTYFETNKDFKELIILSKYLDVLRKLDNEIYYKRKICEESLNNKIKNLSVRIQDKSNDLRDISYYKNQLYRGKVSDAQNYVITQISKKINFKNGINLMVLNKMMVELYCYKILQEEEKLYGLCITILRNVSHNPNLFFKNIAVKTQIRPLRNFLMTHLKHSKFTSPNDSEYFKLMKYIDKHYSNPSFNVEYNLKSTKILLSREFRKITFDLMINKNYKLVNFKLPFSEYQSISSKEKEILNSINNLSNFSGNSNHNRKKTLSGVKENVKKNSFFLPKMPLICYQNLKKLHEILNYAYVMNESLFYEVYDNFFSNSEIDDFGMNKKDYKIPPHYLHSDYINILSNLIYNYFSEHDEKLYLMIMNFSDREKEKSYDCLVCKKTSVTITTQDSINHNFIDRNTIHLGYSNISFENLKYFDVSNIIRIKFDDFMKKENKAETIESKLFYKNISQIKSIFYYITGHYQTNILNVFIEKLIMTNYFNKNFQCDLNPGISTEYFSQKTNKFSFLKDSMKTMFSFDDNAYIKEIIFTKFIEKGILIENHEIVDQKTIRNLILNDLIEIKDKVYLAYNNYQEKDDKYFLENFIYKNGYNYVIKNQLERLSKIDDKMDEFILLTENNHYILENFLDFNLLNPKSIFYKHQDKLNTWQQIILLSKYDTNINIFEIALENLQIAKSKLNDENSFENALIIYGCMIYLKLSNIYVEQYLITKKLPRINEIIKLCQNHMPKLLSSVEDILENRQKITIEDDFLCMDFHSDLNQSEKIQKEELFTNNIFTCNKDISIKCLINNYYKFLNSNNLIEWENRSENYSIKLDNFEILIENGRVIDAYYYYVENLKTEYTVKEVETMLYHICLNNLLNYNIFSAVVTFLYLINGSTKELIVQIEAANRIITYELNILARNEKTISIEEMVNFVKMKNINTKLDKKYFEINEEIVHNNLKQIIGIYKKLVSEFREFKEINKTNNENIVFQILKRLEDATWDGNKQFLLNTPAKEIALDSPWHLVSLFCRIHNYEMSLTLLHELGRNNNWIAFLYKAQDQDCPPANVLMIIDGYFKDKTLKTHLFITIQSMLDTNLIADNLEKKSVSEFAGESKIFPIINYPENLNQNLLLSHSILNFKDSFNTNSKLDFGKKNFNDFNIYIFKQKVKSNQTQNQIYDPLYFMTIPENPKEKGLKFMNILNESVNINWKDLILVSLIFTSFEPDIIFTSFTLYLYMSVKEILITKNNIEEFNTSKNLKILKEIFDNKKKNLKLIDLENLIKVLLLNNHPQVLLEVLELFDIPFSFDEFVLFCKSLFENDYEDAFIHLFIFKNSMYENFESNFSNNFTGKIWEEEGNVNNLHVEFISSEIKTFRQLILVFFFQVSNTIINNLIELYDTKLDDFKQYKLLEILYLTKWNKRYSNYFKNMCVLTYLKNRKIKNLHYKLPYEKIVELLISENNFNILSEYILSYEENKEDDTLLYNIFSTITSFDKNYILYNDEERNQFWECLEKLLIKANFNSYKIAKFFLFILETKESKFYLREQLTLIVKIYQYLMVIENTSEWNDKSHISLKDMDKFTKFMKNVIGYEIDKQIKENELKEDLKNKIFIIVFSNCNFENFKNIFKSRSDFKIDFILQYFIDIIKELREGSPPINFSKSSKTFWNKILILTKEEENKHDNLDKISKSHSNSLIKNMKDSLGNFNDSVKRACLNLINLNQLNLSLHLSIFYNISIEELEKFNSFMQFLIKNFEELKTISYSEINSIYNRGCNKNLETVTNYVKAISYDINQKLIYHLNSCLKYKSIEHIVLYEILKIIISIEIDLNQNLYQNFDENIETILYQLIDTQEEDYKDVIINDLNKIIDNDQLLATTLIEKFFMNEASTKHNIKLFRYVKYFKTPYKLGFAIKNHINNARISTMSKEIQSLDSNYWELIFLGYYCFLKDCYHSELINFNEIIKMNLDEKNFFNSVYKLFNICEDEVRVKEIFYCINKILVKKEPNSLSGNGDIDTHGKFKSEIEFYNKSKNFKKLGEIYLKLANDYSHLIEEKNSIHIVNKRINYDTNKKQQELTILNLYIRAAELFLMDNCILNYSKLFNEINKLVKEKFSDEIDINFQ